ncbi:WD40-repeat-containing domain protein [Gorgonomyces haynaldii]|nr:WD40-repeat-containing domain protein [Gorgonomyces haynaldii]
MKLVKTLNGHTERVWTVQWSPNEDSLVSCSGDKSMRYWKRQSDWELLTIVDTAHSRTVRSIRFSKDGHYLASCSFDATTCIWEKVGSEFEALATLEGHENEVKCMSWSSSNLLATCSRDKSVWIWEAQGDGDFECIAVLQEHKEDVKSVLWHPQEEILCSCSYDNTLKLYREEDDDWVCFQTLSHNSTVWQMDFNKDGSQLVSVGDEGQVMVWQWTDGEYQLLKQLELNDTLYCVSWSPLSGLIAIGSRDNTITILDSDLQVIETQEAHDLDVNCVHWNPRDPKLLVSCSDDLTIKIWQIE